ncbi:glycosyltransferase family 2 protein [Oryzomonas japonica]|uniref:glycosyltransferase family 2 protein n=1 Tax=Oryzomonas japonica TaxID=2603858 RepID=UPI0023B1A4BF|nr:glycosyltransferase family A protein [Oryzomonas japonica]
MKIITIIIPTWNHAQFLEKAVCSVLAQTSHLLEILVCDDGSTDDSEQVVRGIGDSRIRWNAEMRGGRPTLPRNRGIRESRGERIAFLDNYDEWFHKKLAKPLRCYRDLQQGDYP